MKLQKLSACSTQEVFEDHLQLAREGELEKELERNNAEDIVLLTNYGTFRGHMGVREAAALLDKQLPNGTYDYKLKLWHGNMCFSSLDGRF